MKAGVDYFWEMQHYTTLRQNAVHNLLNMVSRTVPVLKDREQMVPSSLSITVEQQRDSASPHSSDSPMSISSPQQHSSASSASSVSSLSGSDVVCRTQKHYSTTPFWPCYSHLLSTVISDLVVTDPLILVVFNRTLTRHLVQPPTLLHFQSTRSHWPPCPPPYRCRMESHIFPGHWLCLPDPRYFGLSFIISRGYCSLTFNFCYHSHFILFVFVSFPQPPQSRVSIPRNLSIHSLPGRQVCIEGALPMNAVLQLPPPAAPLASPSPLPSPHMHHKVGFCMLGVPRKLCPVFVDVFAACESLWTRMKAASFSSVHVLADMYAGTFLTSYTSLCACEHLPHSKFVYVQVRTRCAWSIL